MKREAIVLLRGAASVYIGLCAVLFLFHRSYLYYPQSASANTSQTFALPMTEARVIVSTRPHNGPRAMIYFGGNSEAVSYNMPSFSNALPDRAIYLLHYRGFEGSSGKPSESALFSDGLALFDKVHEEHPDIEIVGRSLGSGVAVYVASLRSATKLVLVTPYDSIEEIAAHQFPYVPVRWLLIDKFQSWKYAPKVTAPTLIIAAEHDQIVPRASTELLRSRFRDGIVMMKVLPETDHNDINENPEFLRLLQ